MEKRYRRALQHGLAIDDSTPAESLHDLRKDGKKLRYVIEFFTPLYCAKSIKVVLRQLKKLQDYLGYFQDLDTHQILLKEITEEMLADHSQSPATLIAIGRLWECLANKQQQTRRGFATAFAPFAAEEVQQAVTSQFSLQQSSK